MSGERRIPTALVLAASSVMVSVGAVAYVAPRMGPEPARREPPGPGDVLVDASTPERAAESFLDAWRKRDHADALRISVGPAHDAARARQEADAHLTADALALKGKLWDAMARSRLDLVIDESRTVEGGRVAVSGVIEGDFLGRPYRRRARFVLTPRNDGWAVERMNLGDILSDEPDILSMPQRTEGTGGVDGQAADAGRREMP